MILFLDIFYVIYNSAVPNLFGTRDQFRGRQFLTPPQGRDGETGGGAQEVMPAASTDGGERLGTPDLYDKVISIVHFLLVPDLSLSLNHSTTS